MIEETITQRLNTLQPDYRAFIESDFLPEVATSLGSVHGLSVENLDRLENAFTLYLLFFLNEEETIGFIGRNCGLNPNDAAQLLAAFKASLPEGAIATVNLGYTLIHSQASSEPLQDEIAETERAFEALQSIRTMAGDMRAIKQGDGTTHHSSQDDLLQHHNEQSGRWESDR